MSDNGENRREFTRVRIQLDAEISADDKASINGVAEDLSLNGVYIPSSGKLPIGTECTIALFLDGRDVRLEVLGKVTRQNDGGMAIEFTGVPLDDLEHLRNLIRFNADDPNAVEEEFDSHIGLKPRDEE
jgi:hypothetical protein